MIHVFPQHLEEVGRTIGSGLKIKQYTPSLKAYP